MRRIVLGLTALVFVFCFVSVAPAQDEDADKAAEEVSVTGKVSVTKEEDAVKAITITSGKGDDAKVYNVALDDNSKGLADHDGKEVTAKGTVAMADDCTMTLTVTSFEVAGEEKKEEGGEEKSLGNITRGMSASSVNSELGLPVQIHHGPKKVFGIKVKDGIELWEYHAGEQYIDAIWLVKFQKGIVVGLGRSQGAVLSDIKFGYLK